MRSIDRSIPSRNPVRRILLERKIQIETLFAITQYLNFGWIRSRLILLDNTRGAKRQRTALEGLYNPFREVWYRLRRDRLWQVVST